MLFKLLKNPLKLDALESVEFIERKYFSTLVIKKAEENIIK